MRFRWVGLLFVLMAKLLLAQAEGEVESIGFAEYYRPECWVPMKVALRPTGEDASELQIRVIQEDLDRDRLVAIRTISLTPSLNGRADKQTFWMYFRPQASYPGLRDTSYGGGPRQLEQQLKVVLTDKDGKTIANLPLTQQALRRVDLEFNNDSPDSRARRMVLCVTDGRSLPADSEYNAPSMTGFSERPMFVKVRPDDLPEDARGYEMVDAILWMGATAPDPARSSEQPRFRAIEQYVRQGGMLVVCQSAELAQTRGFESILPVKLGESRDTTSLEPLVEMARLDDARVGEEARQTRRVALATARSGALTIRYKDWGSEKSPFLVRGRVGGGCVTWVAQDLGEPGLVRSLRKGWIRVWDEVFGWRNNPTELTAKEIQEGVTTPYGVSLRSSPVDMGSAFRRSGELGSRAAGYVLMAVVFFLVYWVVAGPGLYAWLSMRKLATLNWFLFGVVAVAAAGLAMLVVKFFQSGAPELDHVTIVRAAAGEPASMDSRVSLLIRSDGLKTLALGPGATRTLNWITPFPEHPVNMTDDGNKFLAMRQYDLPIQDATNDEPVSVGIPWRNTSKRLQVRWTGEFSTRIEGEVSLTGRNMPEIEGALTNGTGTDLREIYFVYRGANTLGDGTNGTGDRILYVPRWAKGQTIQLSSIFGGNQLYLIGNSITAREAVPGRDKVVYGTMEAIHRKFGSSEVAPGEGWASFWYASMHPGSGNAVDRMNDASSQYQVSLPMCSLFERIPPMRNSRRNDGNWDDDRRQILRIGARWMDVSPAVTTGSLIILAQGNGGIPFPLTVEGDPVKGNGLIIYQFILPIKRGGGTDVEK